MVCIHTSRSEVGIEQTQRDADRIPQAVQLAVQRYLQYRVFHARARICSTG